MSGATYYGIYRGTVVNNIDPMQIGRIMALVPDVGGITPSTWAMPAVPIAGKQMGTFVVPQVGTGGWWGVAAEVPALALAGVPGNPNIVLQTTLQNAIVLSDLPGPTGGIMLKSTTGATIIVNDTGIYIQNGKGASIVLTGPTVTVNTGALVIT
jgi:hypothetical protein